MWLAHVALVPRETDRAVLQGNPPWKWLCALSQFRSIWTPLRLVLDPDPHLQIILFSIPDTCLVSLSNSFLDAMKKKCWPFNQLTKMYTCSWVGWFSLHWIVHRRRYFLVNVINPSFFGESVLHTIYYWPCLWYCYLCSLGRMNFRFLDSFFCKMKHE